MNKLISYFLILSFLLPSFSFANETTESPSIGDIIGSILAGDNSYKSYLYVSENEKAGCTSCTENPQKAQQPLSKQAFYDGWKLNCLALSGSQLCEGIKEEDKIICNEPPKKPWYSDMWEKTKACGDGIKRSWADFFHFVEQIGYYIINKDIEVKNKDGSTAIVGARTHTNQQIAKAWNSMKSYLAMETTKYQDKYHVSSSRAFMAVIGNMMKKFVSGLNAMLAQFAPKVGCYNYKAKTRVICQVLAEFFADPILMFKFIKLGPKVLKGTRIAKFFDYHKAKLVEEVVETTKAITSKTKLLVKNTEKVHLEKVDFIASDSKVAIKIMEHPHLNNSIAKNEHVFKDLFPDRNALDELEVYLHATGKEEADDLAELIKVLGEDRNKMSPEKYKEFVEDVKKSIKKSCEM